MGTRLAPVPRIGLPGSWVGGGRLRRRPPPTARVDELVELGRRLNAVVREAHHGPENVDISELVVLLDGIGGCARVCAHPLLAPGVKRTKLCVGAMSAKVNVHADAETMARIHSVLGANII